MLELSQKRGNEKIIALDGRKGFTSLQPNEEGLVNGRSSVGLGLNPDFELGVVYPGYLWDIKETVDPSTDIPEDISA